MKIFIEKPYISNTDSVKIWVIDDRNGARNEITLGKEGGNIVYRKLNDDHPSPIAPFLELPANFFDAFLLAIVKHASENNIKTDSESALQGKLTATEKHLEDLRSYFDKALSKIVSEKI